ncbi:MAG: HDOD domain-containing protein [Proteobacteria bacterium]|nr:HDOD domain-containing protein [Pseudomonadota bacterium]
MQSQHVPAGNYAIGKKKELRLEACLGTCVGVTLCDRDAQVGGLIHLLLPEPTDPLNPWKAEIYASTGLPLFIEALLEKGAGKNNLMACVAGGALVGPVSRMDLDLDIGGRTTAVVQKILTAAKIPTHKTETGGYFSCRLSIDLNSFETMIQPLAMVSYPETDNFSPPKPDEILNSIHHVRPIPQIALKMARMINDQDYNMSKIAGEIKQDQVLSAKVIQLCNSAFIGLKKKIHSIDRALVLLGEKLLLQLLITASLEMFLSDSSQGYSLCKGGLYQHALGTAIASEELAKLTGKASPEIAYTAGLLHDIGKIVLDQFIVSAHTFFYRRTMVDGIELCKVEKEKLGLTHPQAGGLLAETWSLPEKLTDVIRHHHFPEKAEVDSELTHLVYIADLLMSKFQAGQILENLNMEKLSERLQTVGLEPSRFPIIIERIAQRLFNQQLNHAGLIC